MRSNHRALVRANLLSATLLGGLLHAVTPAWAGCTPEPVVCTGNSPNGAFGTNITVLPFAQVYIADPYAGASARFDVVVLQDNGVMFVHPNGTIQTSIGGTVVRTGQNAQIFHGGSIAANGSGSTGVLLGQNSSITVQVGGQITATGISYLPPSQNIATAIGASGPGTSIYVAGYIYSGGTNVSAIRPVSADLFGTHTYATDVFVASGGQVMGSIWVPGGSKITVEGYVMGRNAIFYEAGSGALSIDLKQTGILHSQQEPVVTGDGADVNFTLAGTILGPSADHYAIALGSGSDRVTITNTASITGIVSGGAGLDTLALSASGAGNFRASKIIDFEKLAVESGQWTADVNLTRFGTVAVGNATLIGSQTVTIGSEGALTVTNDGTIIGGTDWAIQSAGNLVDSVTNSGTITGGSAGAIDLGGGDDALVLRTTSAITGRIEGGAGTDSVTLSGTGTGSFKASQTFNFETLTVGGGQWTADADLTSFSTVAVGNATLTGGQAVTIGSAVSPLTVTNDGTIVGGTAWAIRSTGNVADSVTNSGVIAGGASGAIDLGGGDDSLALLTTSVITGRVDGGAGADSVALSGTGAGSFKASEVFNFETLTVSGGQWTADADLTRFGTVAVGNATLAGGQAVTIGSAAAPLTVTNAGTIVGGTDWAIRSTGNAADSITNAGVIAGGAAGAIDLGGGDDSLILLATSALTGRVDGGAGTDSVTLSGNGGTLGRVENFETLTVNGAGWTLAQGSTFANGISIGANAGLSGSAANVSGPVAIAGTLTIDQPTDATLAAVLSGSGTLVKSGAGTLTIGNQAGFAGQIRIAAGRLALAGTTPASIFVQSGGTLSGNGGVGATTVATGGTIAPGNSIGTLTINGNFSQQAGSIYAVETTAAGLTDLITVNGVATIATGAQLVVTRDGGAYQLGARYVVLTATGGVSGSYTLVQSADPLTEFRLGGTANSIYIDIARTVLGMGSVVRTSNQSSVLAAVASLGTGHQVNAALSMTLADDAIRTNLDNLSGEIHATILPAATRDAQTAQDAALNHPHSKDSGVGIWLQGLYREGRDDGEAGAGRVRSDSHGILGGIDLPVGDQLRLGVAGGYSRAALQLDGRASSARVESTHILVYGDLTLGALHLRGAGGYAWLKNRANRTVVLPGFNNSLLGVYDGGLLHGVAEIGYELPFAGGAVEPFVSLEAYKVETDAFVETGGAAALRREARTETYVISTVGSRFETPLADNLSARARAGWRHVHGNRSAASLMAFASGGSSFRVAGAPLSRNAAAGALDLLWRPKANVTVSAGYSGIIGGAGDDHAAKLGIAIGF